MSLFVRGAVWRRFAQSSAPAWSVGEIEFSGLIDGYYNLNFNHPASQNNQLRNFDVKANQFSLNMAKLTMEHAAEPLGFRMDLGFGRAFEMVHGAEAAPSVFRNIEQAYVSYKPAGSQGTAIGLRQTRDHGRRGSYRNAQ